MKNKKSEKSWKTVWLSTIWISQGVRVSPENMPKVWPAWSPAGYVAPLAPWQVERILQRKDYHFLRKLPQIKSSKLWTSSLYRCRKVEPLKTHAALGSSRAWLVRCQENDYIQLDANGDLSNKRKTQRYEVIQNSSVSGLFEPKWIIGTHYFTLLILSENPRNISPKIPEYEH